MSKKIVQTAGREQLGGFAPEFAHYNDDILFGENWNNQDMDLKTRCIVTMVALMSSGITDSSLMYHLENAKAHGVTRAEAAAIITHVAFYVGCPGGGRYSIWRKRSGRTRMGRKRNSMAACSVLDSPMMPMPGILWDRAT